MRKVLLFDLSDVLIEGLYGTVESLADRLQIPPNQVMLGLGGEPLVALTEGKISEVAYWKQVLERTRWGISEEELQALVRHTFRRTVQGMPELLPSLRRHRLVLLSDHAREWWEHIEAAHPFLQVFERRFLSFEMGQTKRQVATFRHVLAELDCAPDECFFIDDLQWNVDRAKSLGIQAHIFTDVKTLRVFLNEAGIF